MSGARHWVLLVEEPSMEAFLHALLPRVLPAAWSFEIHAFQGKTDLLNKLEARLRGYASWLPADWRVAVVVDRDDDDCGELKQRMETVCGRAGLGTRSSVGTAPWQVVNRIAIEELEAWYVGELDAVRAAYPRVPASASKSTAYRDPDGIKGGTWEAFERLLQRHGYFKGGLAKIEVARTLGRHFQPERCRSPSFACFFSALIET